MIYLIESGEVVQRLRRGVADRGHRPAQVGENICNRNQLAALTLHALFSHAGSQAVGPGGFSISLLVFLVALP